MNVIIFSVIIPVYNGEKYIASCLKSLDKQTIPVENYEVIVVDNNSTDRSTELAREEQVKIIYENKKGSYAARNTGIKAAKGNIIAFTDVDCQVAPNWLELASEHFVNTNDQIVSGAVEFIKQYNLSIWGKYDRNRFLKQELSFSRNGAATANLFVKKDLFSYVGLFDQDLQSGGDTDWVNRATSKGFKFGYNPNLKVYHPVRNSFNEIAKKCNRVGYGKGQFAKISGNKLFLIHPKHLSPGINTLRNILKNDNPNFVYYLKMIFAIYLLNFIEYLGKIKGYNFAQTGNRRATNSS